MKKIVPLLLCLVSLNIHGQEVKAEFDGHKWEAPYHLPIPKDWTIERFLIPISFAPQITYQGVEDIRFTPGWGKVKSEEYWAYAFLWYLDGSHKTTATKIAAHLKAYYTGLIRINTDSTKIPVGKLTPVITAFKKKRADKGDLATYTGTIEMTDFMRLEPITLNCIVHVRSCVEDNKTLFFYELSPKPFTHSNWTALNQLWLDFKCKKNELVK